MVEDFIYSALTEGSAANDIIQYENKPAVFYQHAPNDSDKGWNSDRQYPRIDYNIDWQYNAERKSAGTLFIDVWCTNECAAMPEDITAKIVPEISELFICDNGMASCVLWNRSDAFSPEGSPTMLGVTITFDILQFPTQGSPLTAALNEYTYIKFPSATVIGYTPPVIDPPESEEPEEPVEPPATWKATDGEPSIYWRNTAGSMVAKTTHAVVWFETTLIGHIIAPSPTARLAIIKTLTEAMALDQEVVLADGSPLLITRLTYNAAASPMIEGQISITGQYGVLRNKPAGTVLNHINKSRR